MSKLYIVATPIGNLGDITFRAIEVLKEVEVILAEDTRQTKKLLDHYKIKKSLISCHQHSTDKKIQQIIEILDKDQDTALVSDAGTPNVADPGGKVAAIVAKAGHEVVPIPGVSALTAAVSICGFDMTRFLYLGFLPHKKGRQTLLQEIAVSQRPIVLFESVHRIKKLLNELIEHKVERQIMVARELTKMFETIYRGTPSQVIEQLTEKETKGEFTIIIS